MHRGDLKDASDYLELFRIIECDGAPTGFVLSANPFNWRLKKFANAPRTCRTRAGTACLNQAPGGVNCCRRSIDRSISQFRHEANGRRAVEPTGAERF